MLFNRKVSDVLNDRRPDNPSSRKKETSKKFSLLQHTFKTNFKRLQNSRQILFSLQRDS